VNILLENELDENDRRQSDDLDPQTDQKNLRHGGACAENFAYSWLYHLYVTMEVVSADACHSYWVDGMTSCD